MHKVNTQRSGELLSETCSFLNFYILIVGNYKVKKLFNKFPENFSREISEGNFRTHNPICTSTPHMSALSGQVSVKHGADIGELPKLCVKIRPDS